MTSPNILVILNDDMGYSDIGCYGGEIDTPHLDGLARAGLRMTQFYNTARCCPSRASLLTGLYPHQADVGHMIGNDRVDGYLGDLSRKAVTIAEALKPAGYATAMSGKWHVTGHLDAPGNWPCQRGFDEFYGMLCGAGSYFDPHHLKRNDEAIRLNPGEYFTDTISDEAVAQINRHHERRPDQPLFQYVAYTAPHWPLHALPEDIEKYRGRFAEGWDRLRERRLQRLRAEGLLDPRWDLSPRDPNVLPWEEAPDKAWQQRRMEAYAAQIDRMDQGVGRILDALRTTGRFEDTLILFLSDNGGCAEGISGDGSRYHSNGRCSGREITRDGQHRVRYGNDPAIVPGPEDTYCSYGTEWANLSNTPFRKYKVWTHEGGIATPLIAHWPVGNLPAGAIRHQPAQLPDILPTLLAAAGAPYPQTHQGHPIQPGEGHSLLPAWRDDLPHAREVLYWEHEGNAAVRKGPWKLVRDYPGPWELYHVENDRSELHDLASTHPETVADLNALWQAWADRCHVLDWNTLRSRR
ncbi:MAG: arylsulfatase [Opitutales bacterium]|nr:arylsulfatase [Opitutales bacterium]